MKIDIWTDVVCPFCYIGHAQFKQALDEFAHKEQVTVAHHSFQLQPDADKQAKNQLAYKELSRQKGVPLDVMKKQFGSIAESGKQIGLDMKMLETSLLNTFDGHQLIHFASKHGKQEEAVKAMFEAYFTELQDISDKKVLVRIVKKLGLDHKEFEQALGKDELANAVKSDIKKASELGIQGVPFFVLDDSYGISGAQGTEAFADALETAWRNKHPLHMIKNDGANVCADGSCAVGV